MKQEEFIKEALRIVEEAQKEGIFLRLLGALAIRLHTKKFVHLHKALERKFTDIDLIGYSKQAKKLDGLFTKLGYKARPTSIALYVANRRIYLKPEADLKVDVFLDKLEFCHTIDLRGRLELDFPTITPSDLLLEKMQIVQITEKDLKDTMVLLREHGIDEKDNDVINAKYIAKLLSNDWGFYYTVTTNLKKIKELLGLFGALTDEDRDIISKRIDKLLDYIEKEPKSLKWKIRAKVGTKKKWYREVETIK